MAARGDRLQINGWLVIDKPPGLTSAAVVSVIRRASRASKVGHGGTLDPLATGVLPIALGEATKTVSYIVDGRKIYHFTVRWGEGRTTDDSEGEVNENSDHRPEESEIRAVLSQFCGEIDQVPPTYSAVKFEGRRAYALARADEPVVLAARRVRVDSVELVDMPDRDHARFEVTSGKGVYMRSLARDMAKALGTCGHITQLRRLAVGPFVDHMAFPLEHVQALGHSDEFMQCLLPVGAALAGIPALSLTEAEAKRLQHGKPIAALPVACRSSLTELSRDTVVCAMARGKPVALAQIRGGEIRPLRVLNL